MASLMQLNQLKTTSAGRRKRFLVTSVQVDSPVHEGALKTIKHACKRLKMMPILLGSRAHTRALQAQPQTFDPKIQKILGNVLYRDCVFNEHLYAVDAQLNPQQMNPLTGMSRYKFRQNSASVIIASPKLSLQTIAVDNNGLPRIVASTGTISLPTYQKTRAGMLSKQTHKMAGWIFELLDGGLFLARPIEFLSDGSFVDMAVQYFPDGTTKNVQTSALIMGDLHAERIRVKSLKMSLEQLRYFNPLMTVVHDIISFSSITHHNQNNTLEQLRIREEFPTLEAEVSQAKKALDLIFDNSNSVGIVASNHHDHLYQWLDKKGLQPEIADLAIYHKLKSLAAEGVNVVQHMLDPAMKHMWWDSSDDFRINGVHVSSHGHRGGNGSKGSPRQLSDYLGPCFCGHTHSATIFEDYWCVGTNSMFDMLYNQGPSSWIQANGVVYETGTRQMIIGIPGTDVWKGSIPS